MPPRVLALAAAVVLLPTASAAAAGTYTVTSCKNPPGAANAAPGWSAINAGAGVTANDCAAGGSLNGTLPGTPTGGTSAAWRFTAPAATRVVALRAARRTTGISRGTRSTDLSYQLTLDDLTLERCDVSDTSPCATDLSGVVEKEGLSGTELQFRISCLRGADQTCSNALRLDVSQAAVVLADHAAPTVRDVRVADDGERSGVLRVLFDAADEGGGVFRAITLVDGVVKQVQTLGGAACVDADPADGDSYQFVEPKPCAGVVDEASAAVDVRTLTPGAHAVEIRVEDAAGNVASVYTTDFPRLNAPGVTTGAVESAREQVLRGRVTARWVESRSQRLTARYGLRHVIRGFLRGPSGRGIVGARIDVVHILPGGRRLVKTGMKTRGGGAFTLIVPRNLRSRRIEIQFRAVRPGPVTSRRTMRLDVVRRDGRTRVV